MNLTPDEVWRLGHVAEINRGPFRYNLTHATTRYLTDLGLEPEGIDRFADSVDYCLAETVLDRTPTTKLVLEILSGESSERFASFVARSYPAIRNLPEPDLRYALYLRASLSRDHAKSDIFGSIANPGVRASDLRKLEIIRQFQSDIVERTKE
jgi:hypothetical protein